MRENDYQVLALETRVGVKLHFPNRKGIGAFVSRSDGVVDQMRVEADGKELVVRGVISLRDCGKMMDAYRGSQNSGK